MIIEIIIFIVVSSIFNIVGLVKKRRELDEDTILEVLFRSYSVASISTILTSCVFALLSDSLNLADNVSLFAVTFFGLQLLLALTIYIFYKRLWDGSFKRM